MQTTLMCNSHDKSIGSIRYVGLPKVFLVFFSSSPPLPVARLSASLTPNVHNMIPLMLYLTKHDSSPRSFYTYANLTKPRTNCMMTLPYSSYSVT